MFITVTARANTGSGFPVGGAGVHLDLYTASGLHYVGDGVAGTVGTVTFSFKPGPTDGLSPPAYTTTATASRSGYTSGSGSTTFTVV